MQSVTGPQGCGSRCDGEYAPGSDVNGIGSRQESSSHEMARELNAGHFPPGRDAQGHQIKVSTEGRATKRTAGRPADRACQPPIGFRNAQRFGSWNQAQHLDLMAHPAAVLATAT